jgi:hypothetical protein
MAMMLIVLAAPSVVNISGDGGWYARMVKFMLVAVRMVRRPLIRWGIMAVGVDSSSKGVVMSATRRVCHGPQRGCRWPIRVVSCRPWGWARMGFREG